MLPQPHKLTHLWLSRWLGHDWAILVLGAVIGAFGGAVAALFGFAVEYLARTAWGDGGSGAARVAMLLLVPALGGLLVGFIQTFLARTGPTHGIPEVVAAIARRQGEIPAATGLWKALTSALTLGSGGCAGLEGPVVTIGAATGSSAGRMLGARREDLPVLVSCGMAAAIAAAFNAPIAGVLFVLEVVLCDFSLRMFMPIVVASVAGMVASQGLRGAVLPSELVGHGALFRVDRMPGVSLSFSETPAFVVLGLLCGFLGFAITGLLHWSEPRWRRVPGPAWLRPAWGGLALGLMGWLFGLLLPHAHAMFHALSGQGLPAFMGNGYSIIESLFKPGHFQGAASYAAGMLAAVVAFKLAGLALTIGSGGSGGAIAPSLFVGAAAGACLGCVVQATGWFPHSSPALYAIVGMAGVIAGSFRCPLTAFVLVFELTQDYTLILPAMAVSILAVAFARGLRRESLVSEQLRSLGIRTGQGAAALRRTRVAEIPLAPVHVLGLKDPVIHLVSLVSRTGGDDFVVLDAAGAYAGMVHGDAVRRILLDREALPLLIIEDILDPAVRPVRPDDSLDEVLDRFGDRAVGALPVQDEAGRVLGLLTREQLVSQYHRIMSGE